MSFSCVLPAPHAVRRGSGLPLLMIHGNGVDHRLLLPLDEALAAAGALERIYLDLPGFGRTAPLDGPGGLPEIADWLEEAAAELIGEASFAVLGNSMGGLLARELAARHRERCAGIALLAPVVDPVREHRRLPPRTVLRTDPELLAALDAADAADYAEMAVEQSAAGWERFAAAALPGIRAADPGAGERLGARYALPAQPDDRLAGIDVPVLVVAGRQDHVVGFEDQQDLAARFPHASSAVLDRAGHNVHLDQPEQVAAMLRAWAGQVLA
ncbi:alpha/beta hydrolase [Brachybacterium phenoliresistens]|uniref:alpha/beta fold hydrolase n=1 Tax=Brachybacterium phenoliresistens TaxID=396014 RepID=UPI0031CE02B9